MTEYWKDFWETKAGAERIFKGLLYILGVLFQFGVIPTGVDNAGDKIGPALQALAIVIPAGEKNKANGS